jgi:hypothetical protein
MAGRNTRKAEAKLAKRSADKVRTKKLPRSTAGDLPQALDPSLGEPVTAFHAKEAIRKGNRAVLARYLMEAREVILAVADKAEKLTDRPRSDPTHFQTHYDESDPLPDYEEPDAGSALDSITNGNGSTLADFLRGLEDVHFRLAQALRGRSGHRFRLKFVTNREVGKPPKVKLRDQRLAMQVAVKRKTKDYKTAIYEVAIESGHSETIVKRAWSKLPKSMRTRG